MGPYTESCGTPGVTGTLVEHSPSITTCWFNPISKKTGNPTVGVTRNTIVLQLMHHIDTDVQSVSQTAINSPVCRDWLKIKVRMGAVCSAVVFRYILGI